MTGHPSTLQSPIAIVESLVPPNLNTGKPSAGIKPPRGPNTIDGAVYIGLGFVQAGTNFRKACAQAGDWTYGLIGGAGPDSARLELVVAVGAYPRPVQLLGAPSLVGFNGYQQTEVDIELLANAFAADEFRIRAGTGIGAGQSLVAAVHSGGGITGYAGGRISFELALAPNQFFVDADGGGNAGDATSVAVRGYRTHAPRLLTNQI
jgi:hypothetical protein